MYLLTPRCSGILGHAEHFVNYRPYGQNKSACCLQLILFKSRSRVVEIRSSLIIAAMPSPFLSNVARLAKYREATARVDHSGT